jgi:hypothetical protein
MTAISAENVELGLDANGNGVNESTQVVTWESLDD